MAIIGPTISAALVTWAHSLSVFCAEPVRKVNLEAKSLPFNSGLLNTPEKMISLLHRYSSPY
jgi:hypothetical protein